jgi:hypothetical protein
LFLVLIFHTSCGQYQTNVPKDKPTVTEIKSGGPALLGLFAANDGSIWVGAFDGVYRYDGQTLTDFKSKEGRK